MSRRTTLAYVHGLEVTHSWHASTMALVSHDVANHQRVIGGGWLATKYGTGGIVQARNDTVAQFLKMDSEWLFWVDTDMGFSPDALDRLHEVADADSAPLVGGLCFMNRECGPDGMGGMLVQPMPTIFQWVDITRGEQSATGFACMQDYPRNQLVRIAATGSAFVLIHRSVFERVEQQYGRSWYSPVYSEGTGMWLSEDLSLCTRAGALEIPMHVHTGVQTSHLKHYWLDERVCDRMQRLEG